MSGVDEILEKLRPQPAGYLPELVGFELLAALGFRPPRSLAFDTPRRLTEKELMAVPGRQVVLKGICPQLTHKTEVGAVAAVPREPEAILDAARQMQDRLDGYGVVGFFLQERIDYDVGLGNELLMSLRWDREFGPVVTCGPGGIHAEALARDLRRDRALLIVPAVAGAPRLPLERLMENTAIRLMTTGQRGRPPLLPHEAVVEAFDRLITQAGPLLEAGIEELEINPLVVRGDHLVPLDVLVKWSPARVPSRLERPLHKLHNLLEPASIAIVGVSRNLNPGHVILKNILRAGFSPERIFVIKPGEKEIEGCPCVPEVEDLPERVDLLVVAIGADQVPDLLARVCRSCLAESLIVIPGGLEERKDSESLARSLEESLRVARGTEWQGPLVNGGNCMGIQSSPGRYDTFFLPEHKLTSAMDRQGRVALLSQSGAFLAARSSKLAAVPCKYNISIGNQIDVTLGDYLSYLADDDDLQVVGVYVEGFRDLDGRRFLAAAARMRSQGRAVVLYRAGRSAEGAKTAASHTASLAGSYEVTVALAADAGILVAETLDDFEDLVELAMLLVGRPWSGRRLVGLSNAGFECVAFSDRLGWFLPSPLSPVTRSRVGELLDVAGVSALVEARNPLDVTPMMGDELFCRCAETLLADSETDAGVIGCVPLTGSLQTLPAARFHDENLRAREAIVGRLAELWQQTRKPWVAVVDAGHLYDPMAAALRGAGIPTFRTLDRALQLLETYARWAISGSPAGDPREAQG